MFNRLRKPIALLATVALLMVAGPIAVHGQAASSGAVPSASTAAVTR